MAATLRYTGGRYGAAKRAEYRDLIRLALTDLAADAHAGKQRPDIHPAAWTFHIARRGLNARHLLLYRVREAVEVARFLHDAMDLPRYWPEDWQGP
jgi:plasmid stabilization system protein ParE